MTRLAAFLALAGLGLSPALPAGQSRPAVAGPYLGQTPPGRDPEVFAPGLVSTGAEHSSAMFSPDGTEIWFARLSPTSIFFMRLEDGVWRGPNPAPFSSPHGDLYPQLSPDGRLLIFASHRPLEPGGEPLPRGATRLWVVERVGGGWSEPRPFGPGVNIGVRQGGGSVSDSGRVFFDSAGRPGPGPSTDIFWFELESSDRQEARLVEEIASPSPQHSPFVAPDESYLIFSSFRGGFGLSDLFISFREPGGAWGEPINMGSRVNSAAKDEYPYVTPDGRFLFFNSNRVSTLNRQRIPDGPGNIYWMDAGIIEELRAEPGAPGGR